MNPSQLEEEKQLRGRLQDELLLLKNRLGRHLTLKKATATAPFPIHVTARIDTPAVASQYDVSCLKVVATLDRAFLTSRGDGLALHAHSDELPAQLRDAISQKLRHAWADQVAQDSSAQLQALLDYVQEHYLELLTVLPCVLEAYEAVNSAGATVRRYAFVDASQGEQTPSAPTATPPATELGAKPTPPTAARPAACETARLASTTVGSGAPQSLSGPPQPPPTTPVAAASKPPADVATSHTSRSGKAITHPAPSASSGGTTPASPRPPTPSTQPAMAPPPRAAPAPAASPQRSPQPHAQPARGPQPTAAAAAAAAALAGIMAPPARSTAMAHRPACLARPPPQPQRTTTTTPAANHLAAEVAYLQRRFPAACTVRPPTSAGGAAFTLTLQPTDPAWPPRTPLALQGHAQPAYPAPGSFSLQLPATSQLPRATQQALNTRLRERAASLAGQATPLRALVKELENYASQLARPQSPPPQVGIATATTSGAAGGQEEEGSRRSTCVAAEQAASSASGSTSSRGSSHGSGGDWYSSDGSGSGSDSEASQGEGQRHGREEQLGPSAVAGGQCYRVALHGCVLEGADALDAICLKLQVACTRCGELATATLASREALDSLPPGGHPFEHIADCGRCAQPWGVSLRPEFVHSTSHVLGLLRAAGCAPRDLLPSVVGLQCAACCETSALRAVQLGAPTSRRCGACHERIGVCIDAAAFLPVAAPTLPGGGGGRVAAGAGNGQHPGAHSGGGGVAGGGRHGLSGPHAVLTVGEPLPDLGTCKHYRHSHRWLRFPCCGMRFPCDLCHEEGTDGHEMRWAVRMVCGFCSLEQVLGERCGGCDKRLACAGRQPAGRSTRFWEGGQGCRDKRAMDSRDAHKWRNSRFKTKSAKHKRVGPKAVPRDKDKDKA